MYHAKLLKSTHINQNEWNQFISNSPQKTIYGQTWYLNIVCKKWQGLVIQKENKWVAIMPINIIKKHGITYSFQPMFAKYLGVFFNDLIKSSSEKESILDLLLKSLPSKIKAFNANFNPSILDLGKSNKNFKISPKYTYRLNLTPNIEDLFNSFSSSLKKNIKQGINKGVIIEESNDIQEIIQLHIDNKLLNKNQAQLIEELWTELRNRNLAFCLYAKSKEGDFIGGCSFIINYDTAHGLVSANDKKYNSLFGSSLLNYERIKKIKSNHNINEYDFEGSMIPSIERFFKKFGPKKTKYYNVSFNKLPILSYLNKLIK